MSWRLKAVFLAGLGLAACGGNPFIDTTTAGGGGAVGGGGAGGGAGGGGATPVNTLSLGNLQSFSYTPGAPTMSITLTAQDAAALTATYSRNAAFDITGYEAYTYQETTSNRFVVALVRQVGTLTGALGMEGGQFVNYYGGTQAVRADGFTFDAAAVSGTLGAPASYSGTYVGIMNVGYPAPGGPGGDLNPEIGYRVTGRTLITADFTELTVTGGVDTRRIVETSAVTDGTLPVAPGDIDGVTGQLILPSIGLFESTITADGTFAGEVYRGTQSVGSYSGIFGENADEVAALLVFQPLPITNLEERGLIVLPSCAIGGGPACP